VQIYALPEKNLIISTTKPRGNASIGITPTNQGALPWRCLSGTMTGIGVQVLDKRNPKEVPPLLPLSTGSCAALPSWWLNKPD